MKAEHPIRRSVERAGAFDPWLYDREFIGMREQSCKKDPRVDLLMRGT